MNFPPIPMTGGATFSAADLQGSWTLLFFYPKDNTPACTLEAQAFRDAYAQFQALGVKVYGVSRDSLPSHQRFMDKQCLPFPLISDSEEALCRAFDVIQEKNLYGKQVMGIVRSTFLINPQGERVREWRKVKVAGHIEEVLQAVQVAQAE